MLKIIPLLLLGFFLTGCEELALVEVIDDNTVFEITKQGENCDNSNIINHINQPDAQLGVKTNPPTILPGLESTGFKIVFSLNIKGQFVISGFETAIGQEEILVDEVIGTFQGSTLVFKEICEKNIEFKIQENLN